MKCIKALFIAAFFEASCVSCEGLFPQYYGLAIRNLSNRPIAFLIADPLNTGIHYPDTTIPPSYFFYLEDIDSLGGLDFTIGTSWKDAYQRAEIEDYLSVFIFDMDTLAKYSWEEVMKNYLIEVRYDLSWRDMIEHRGDKYPRVANICYPPDSNMKNVHMYPPFDIVQNKWGPGITPR